MKEARTYNNYLRDLSDHLKRMAFEAKKKRDSSIGTDNEDFAYGYLLAFNAVVSLMQQQADAFLIPRAEIELDNINPDKDLI